MAVPRFLSQSGFSLFRGFRTRCATTATVRIVTAATPRQNFSSNRRLREEVTQTPATGVEVPLTSTNVSASGDVHKRSIAITKMPFITVPADVEQLLRNAGFEIKRLQFKIDRFTFHCDTNCFVELGSQEQAQKALKTLDGHQFGTRKLKVRPLSDTFYWDAGFQKNHRMFYHDATTPSQAIQGLLDHRRYALFVEAPGWKFDRGAGKSDNVHKKELIDKHFGPFGVETTGAFASPWKFNKSTGLTFVTTIEFASKDSAERAVKALNNQVVEGKKVQLKPANLEPYKIEQFGKVDKSLLAQLQQHGLLPNKPSSEVEA